MTCKVEVKTGTNLSRPICRSDLERQEDIRQAWQMLMHPTELHD